MDNNIFFSKNANYFELVQNNPLGLDGLDDDGKAMIHWAIIVRNNDAISALLSSGVDIDCQDENGLTPLHTACIHRQNEVAMRLIDAGANVNILDFSNTTILMLAVRYSAVNVITEILSNIENINSKDFRGTTAINWLTINKNEYREDIYALLIEHGADERIKDRIGKSALDRKSEYERVK